VFGPRLKTIEKTADRTVLRENSVYVACIFPFVISVLPIALWIASPDFRGTGAVAIFLSLVSCAMFFATGLSALVTSTFCISRVAGTLTITRKLLRWVIEKEYSATDILTVFADRTFKGNRLMMRLRSGQVKRFTIYGVYASLEAQAGMVNGLLHEARLSAGQAAARDPLVH
jgi:hypothetical protein